MNFSSLARNLRRMIFPALILLFLLIPSALLAETEIAGMPEARDYMDKITLPAEAPKFELIALKDAPDFIRNEARKTLQSCAAWGTDATKARVFRFTLPDYPEAQHFIIDFIEFTDTPAAAHCKLKAPLCDDSGCTALFYTWIEADSWELSATLRAQKINFIKAEDARLDVPAVDVTRDEKSCAPISKSISDCSVRISWQDNRFHYVRHPAGAAEKAQIPTPIPVPAN